jgi:hypothetical protein
MRQSISLTISGKNGIFSQENTLSLFLGHTTKTNLTESMKELKKLSANFVKSGELMITVCAMDSECKRTDRERYIYRGGWNGTIVLDVRKFNGYDYSESKELHFTKDLDLIKYLIGQITTTIHQNMGSLPLENSYYSQILENEELVPADVREFVKR